MPGRPLLACAAAAAFAFAAAGCGHPAVPAAPPAGELTIRVAPPGPGTNVLLDGDFAFEIPAAGQITVHVPAATYRVQIERDGFYSIWRIVEVPPPPRPALLELTMHEVLE